MVYFSGGGCALDDDEVYKRALFAAKKALEKIEERYKKQDTPEIEPESGTETA